MSHDHDAVAKYKVYFDHTAWRKMMAYTKYAKGEVGGLGLVDEVRGRLHIADTFILPQSATASSVEYDDEAFSKLVHDKVKAGDKKFTQRLRMVWHSHADIGCFHSGTDKDTVNTIVQSSPYVLSVVTNKKGGCDISLVIQRPLRVVVKEVEFVMIYNDGLEARCRKEVEEMVHEVPSRVTVHYEGGKDRQFADWNEYWREQAQKRGYTVGGAPHDPDSPLRNIGGVDHSYMPPYTEGGHSSSGKSSAKRDKRRRDRKDRIARKF